MNPQKSLSDPKNLVYRLVEIVKTLSPHQRSKNPYQDQMQTHIQTLDLEEQILLHNLVHSITILNQNTRKLEGKTLISTPEDNLNALELILPNQRKIKESTMLFKQQLESFFGYDEFLKVDALEAVKVRSSTFIRHANKLIAHGLMRFVGLTKGVSRRSIYQLIEPDIKTELPEEEPSIFDQASEEFQDFTGWTDLQHRT